MNCNKSDVVVYDEEGINYDDIPEITDFSKAMKNPFVGRFKNGYTVIVEHEGYNEERIYDFTKIPRPANGSVPIPVAVNIVKVGDGHGDYIERKLGEAEVSTNNPNTEWIEEDDFRIEVGALK